MCEHRPACPPADARDRDAARVLAAQPTQGWSLLCNGVVLFDDLGEILPTGAVAAGPAGPARPPVRPDGTWPTALPRAA